jgi:hypothetical protein
VLLFRNEPAKLCPLATISAEFRRNLQVILEAALSVSRVVVVITPPPVDSARWPDRSVEQVGT